MLGEVVHQEAGDLELVDEGAAFIGGARPVSVPVEEQAEVVAAAGQNRQGLVDVRTDRLGVDPAEIGVPLLVDLVDPDAPSAQQAGDPAAPGAPHRVHEDRQVRRPQGVEIERPPHEPLVSLERIEPLDEPGGLGVVE